MQSKTKLVWKVGQHTFQSSSLCAFIAAHFEFLLKLILKSGQIRVQSANVFVHL